jgi:hypothetical protein
MAVYVGALAGINEGEIINCHIEGYVHLIGTASYTGGLVGYNDGSITDCSVADGTVSGGTSDRSSHAAGTAGGLAGYSNGSITNCYATCSVAAYARSNSYSYAGGLVGENSGSISLCYATGTVSGDYAGGLVGRNDGHGSISNCYAIGTITRYSGDGCAGGLVGANNSGSLTDCYTTGAVIPTNNYHPVVVGGLVGSTSGSISRCYSAGEISGRSTVGGFVGSTTTASITFLDCYFLKRSSAPNGVGRVENQANITGYVTAILSEADMRQRQSFPGFFNASTLWDIKEGESYPYLRGVGDYIPVGSESAVVIKPPSGNEEIPAVVAAPTAYAYGGTLYIQSPRVAQITVYSLTGAKVYEGAVQSGTTTINAARLPKGVYIVAFGDGTRQKVWVSE